MLEIMEFIENMSMDDQLYWHVPDIYKRGQFEVQWRRGDAASSWRYRQLGSSYWQRFNNIEFIDALNKDQVDLMVLEQHMAASMITQSVFAQFFLTQAMDVFGKECLEQAFNDGKKFMNQITDKVNQISSTETPQIDIKEGGKKILSANLKLIRPS